MLFLCLPGQRLVERRLTRNCFLADEPRLGLFIFGKGRDTSLTVTLDPCWPAPPPVAAATTAVSVLELQPDCKLQNQVSLPELPLLLPLTALPPVPTLYPTIAPGVRLTLFFSAYPPPPPPVSQLPPELVFCTAPLPPPLMTSMVLLAEFQSVGIVKVPAPVAVMKSQQSPSERGEPRPQPTALDC